MATSPEKSNAILRVDAMTSIYDTTRLKSSEGVSRYMFISVDFDVSRKATVFLSGLSAGQPARSLWGTSSESDRRGFADINLSSSNEGPYYD